MIVYVGVILLCVDLSCRTIIIGGDESFRELQACQINLMFQGAMSIVEGEEVAGMFCTERKVEEDKE